MTGRRLRRPQDVAEVRINGTTFVARVPDGPIQVLSGSATVIWDEALAGGREDLARRVAECCGAEFASIQEQVESFVGVLLAMGLLTEDGPGSEEHDASGPSI